MTWQQVLDDYFPPQWVSALKALTYSDIQEVRELHIREEAPLCVVTVRGMRYLCPSGLTELPQTGVLYCTAAQLRQCISLLCEESVYAYQEQLRQGFIPLRGGIRVGVGGHGMVQDGQVTGIGRVTSLCIRLPSRQVGCGRELLSHIAAGGLRSTLLVGEPVSGKTTLLRDIAASLSNHYRVTVVDERGELAGVDGLATCDVLAGYPKGVGILQAIRCLSPQVIVFDEMGEETEVEAVSACAHAGVAVVASLHGSCPDRVVHRPVARLLLQRQVFDQWVFLVGRDSPGRVWCCLRPEVTGCEIRWVAADRGGGSGFGAVRSSSPVPPSGGAGAADTGAGNPWTAAGVFRPSYGGALAAVGADG